ncbi:uncharacterized protein LOC129584619 isoform X2 [Paramacrobiotus metropolitanus]|uniref:uncharacterized protein LOC129584619 isoform X2 n=1 Tax=Paramacrobiotus metropolitanus TaxID=2943436 RepID=UPI0024459A3A|nr:uncharacterized protein LOC129584619 isoform X2 [Paramacrobiotus metropolitanus]
MSSLLSHSHRNSASSSSASLGYALPDTVSSQSTEEHEPFTEETCCVKLRKVGRSTDQVRGLSAWIFHHRSHLSRVAKLWLAELKKAPPGRRLTLYYVAYETLAICKKKKFEKGFPCFQAVLREATVYCRDRECKIGVRKVFAIFKEAQFFSDDYLKQLRDDLEKGRSVSNHNKVVLLDFEPGVISKIHEQMEEFREEHAVGKEYLARFDAAFQHMRDLEDAREQDLKQSYDLLNQLELLRVFYSTTSKEAEKVIVAYGNYERVAQNGMSHLEKAQRLLNIPLPNLVPAEPEAADVVDMELSDDEADATKKPVGFLGEKPVDGAAEVNQNTMAPADSSPFKENPRLPGLNNNHFAALLSSLPVAPPIALPLPSIPVQSIPSHTTLLPLPPPSLPPYAYQPHSVPPPNFYDQDEYEDDLPVEPLSTGFPLERYDSNPLVRDHRHEHDDYDEYDEDDYDHNEQTNRPRFDDQPGPNRPLFIDSSPLMDNISPPRHPPVSLLGPPPTTPTRPPFEMRFSPPSLRPQNMGRNDFSPPRFRPAPPNGKPALLSNHPSPQIRQSGQYIQYIPASAVSPGSQRMPLLASPVGPSSPHFDQHSLSGDHNEPQTPFQGRGRGRRGFGGRQTSEGRGGGGRGRGAGGMNGRVEDAHPAGTFSIPSLASGSGRNRERTGGAQRGRGVEHMRGRGRGGHSGPWKPQFDEDDNEGGWCAGTGSNLIPVVTTQMPNIEPVGESVTDRLIRLANMK